MIQFCKFQLIELIKGALLYTFGYVVRCAVPVSYTHLDVYKRQASTVTVGFQKGSSMTPFEKLEELQRSRGGSLCALCETFFTQESFRGCGLRKPAKGLEESLEKGQRPFSCLRQQKVGFAECASAGLGGGATLQRCFAKSSENGLCPFSGPHTEKQDNAESRGAVVAGTFLQR